MTAPLSRLLARGTAALGLGLLGLAAPALAADPATFAGEEVTPAGNVIEATPVGPGLYTVAVPEGDAEQYVEVKRTIPGSTLWYGASAVLPKSDGSTAPLLTLESSPDGSGDSCVGFESLSDTLDQSTFSTRLFTTTKKPACQAADSLVLRTAATDVPAGRYQLVVWEEPPLEEGATLPDRSVTVPWAALPSAPPDDLVPGTTYADAPEVTAGTYAVHVEPGEPALVKVPLTWGQHAQVAAVSSTRTTAYATVGARWLSPLGGVLGETGYSGGPTTTELTLNSTPTTAGWATPTIAWKNREGKAGDTPAAIAGDYYLSIDTFADKATKDGVDLTLNVGVVTDYPATAPPYAEDPPALPYVDGTSGPGSGGSDGAGGSGTAAGDAGREAGTSWTLVGGLFGAAALFAVAGVVALGRRGRTG
ncbi:hypothetical protein H5V45_11655 [Nocardioides sp. KIGAM211]|uniref:Peptidase n=1 Tax=Nocardioides luti TaxID=2761101 RepID=A0A7X0VBH2_9ACTN|nr:hypothetical protein [Nocardioides luti]MBB6627972.1 hypothetical protein [Nocardioides luti]